MGNLINGPFETERDARAAAHTVVQPEAGWSILRKPQNRLLLERACEAAGVELGLYDRRIMDWLSGFEDSICGEVPPVFRTADPLGFSAERTGKMPKGYRKYSQALRWSRRLRPQ